MTGKERWFTGGKKHETAAGKERKTTSIQQYLLLNHPPSFESVLKNSKIKGVGKNCTNKAKQKFNFNPKGQEWVWKSSIGAGLRATE